jgi:hypothetical protein
MQGRGLGAGAAPGGRERQHHAACIVLAPVLADQALLHQRLRGAAGLALVQVGLLGRFTHRQRCEAAHHGEAARIAERARGRLETARLAGLVRQLVQQVQPVDEAAVQRRGRRLGLCRCITRPALSEERVQLNAAAQVKLGLEPPWRDGLAGHWTSCSGWRRWCPGRGCT